MNWIREVGSFEIAFILVFVIAYTLYIARVIKIGTILKTSYRNIVWKLIIRTIYFLLIGAALLGPAFGESSKEIKAVGKDIFIAIDLSESMNAHDIQPTRLQKIKFELKKVVKAFSSDRIGIIIFSSEAFMQCPLTFDQNALNMFTEILNTGLVPNAGTDFGPPLKMALEKLDEPDATITQQKSKIIVLISDGEDFGEETESVVEEINNKNIKLFTLGVGTEEGSKIKTTNGFKLDNQGMEVVTKLSSNSLRKIASDTDGQYFEINDGDNDIERMINAINGIEGEVRDVRHIDVTADKYYYFLMAALGLILIDVLFSFKVIRI